VEKEDAAFQSELDIIYRELSQVFMDAFYRKFDFAIDTNVKETIQKLKSYQASLNKRNSSGLVKYAITQCLINILDFFLTYLIEPTVKLKRTFLQYVSRHFDEILESIIRGSLEGLYSTVESNQGFNLAIQTCINNQLKGFLNSEATEQVTAEPVSSETYVTVKETEV